MNGKFTSLCVVVAVGAAACSHPTDDSTGRVAEPVTTGARTSDVTALATAVPAAAAPATPSSTTLAANTMPPLLLQGDVLAALRRPARALRTDGTVLYAVGLPFTAMRVNPGTGGTTEVPFGPQFHDAAGVWLGAGVLNGHLAVHVTDTPRSSDRLLIIDFETSTISTIDIPTNEPTVLATPFNGDRAYLATQRSGRIAEIDPSSMHVGVPHEVPGATSLISAIARGGSVWVVDPPGAAVLELNAADLTVKRRIAVATNPALLTMDGDTVWVGHPQGATVTRINAVTGEVVAEIELLAEATEAVSVAAPAIVAVDGRVFARLRLQNDGEPYGVVAEIDTTHNALAGWRTAGRDIYSMINFGNRLLVLDDLNRVVDVDLGQFRQDRGAPWHPSTPSTFEPNPDERAVMDTFSKVYNLSGDPTAVLTGVDEPRDLADIIPAAYTAARAAGIHAFVPVAAVVAGDDAWVSWNALDNAGTVVLEDSVALLRRHQGTWKVRRTKLCLDLAVLGVECPPG
jgi:DNA-binding beta-propeller fold protein YncE